MIVLAVDASGPDSSVALRQDGLPIGERFRHSSRGHGATLLRELHVLLDERAISLEEIDLFVASSGPGSFTGVRVGLATVTALAWSLGKPVTAFDTLSALALNGRGAGPWLAPVLDARKGEVYGGLFRCVAGEIQTVIAADVRAPDRWVARLREEVPDGDLVYLGTGVAAYPEHFVDSNLDPRVHAAALAALGEEAWLRGGRLELPPAIPRYVRPSEAEIKFGPAPSHDPVRAVQGRT